MKRSLLSVIFLTFCSTLASAKGPLEVSPVEISYPKCNAAIHAMQKIEEIYLNPNEIHCEVDADCHAVLLPTDFCGATIVNSVNFEAIQLMRKVSDYAGIEKELNGMTCIFAACPTIPFPSASCQSNRCVGTY